MGQKTLPNACSIVGLGRLGAPLAAVLARAGFDVFGVDLNANVVAALNEGRAPYPEPGLQEVIDDSEGRLRATTDVAEAVGCTEVSFVIVPTPSDESGRFRNDFVVSALQGLGAAVAAKASYHVAAVTSTVMPGSVERDLGPALEQSSGRQIGTEVGLCYSPTFIALGSVINDLTRPNLVLLGESDPRAGDVLASVYERMCTSSPSVRRMNWVNAEIAKIAVNTFVTTKISYANMLSELCEQLPGADVDMVSSAVGDDRRIGHAYLRGATAYGGPCFPRDNVALARAANDVGVDALLATATDAINSRQAGRLAEIVAARARVDDRIAILGVAYKPDTGITEESAGLAVASQLLASGYEVACFDPGLDPGVDLQIAGLKVTSTLEECVGDAAVIVVMTPCAEFRDLPGLLAGAGTKPLLVDCWRLFDAQRDGVEVMHLGTGPATMAPDRAPVLK
jgi:UDPglucose 6-dehydrogenase